MFTGITIAVTVLLLWFVAGRFYMGRKILPVKHADLLALASFMAGLGILCYGIRTLFVDFGQFDYYIYRIGITVHLGLSFIIAAIFLYENYIKTREWRYLFIVFTALFGALFTYGTAIPPLKRVEKIAPFEPFPFRLTSYPWQDPVWNKVFIYFSIIISLMFIWTCFVYSYKKLQNRNEHKKVALLLLTPLSLMIFAMPFAAQQPWFPVWQYVFFAGYLILSLTILFSFHFYVSKKNILDISLYYGLGMAYLLFSGMLCIFITPVFARLLYVFGAIFLFLALKKESLKITTS